MYGFAGDGGGQVGGHLTRGEVLAALYITERVPGACTRAVDVAGTTNMSKEMDGGTRCYWIAGVSRPVMTTSHGTCLTQRVRQLLGQILGLRAL